jgi:hypothetical protein
VLADALALAEALALTLADTLGLMLLLTDGLKLLLRYADTLALALALAEALALLEALADALTDLLADADREALGLMLATMLAADADGDGYARLPREEREVKEAELPMIDDAAARLALPATLWDARALTLARGAAIGVMLYATASDGIPMLAEAGLSDEARVAAPVSPPGMTDPMLAPVDGGAYSTILVGPAARTNSAG